MSCRLPWAFDSGIRQGFLGFSWAFYFILVCSVLGCGTTNQLESKGEKNADEQIRVALDAGDLVTARQLLELQVVAEPLVYSRFVLLGAVYANLSGFDVLGSIKGGAGGSTSALDTISGFLPGATTADSLLLMQKAIDSITSVPAELRQTTSTERYSLSAVLQLGLYQAVYAVMYLRQFLAVTAYNQYDLEKLSTMTAADATLILYRLSIAASGSPLDAKIQSTLDGIDSSAGTDDRERLIAYVAATKK